MKKGWRQTAFCLSGNKSLPLRHHDGRGALLRLVPAILAILAALILASPAVCGDNTPVVAESSRTYKDPVCNFMVKDLENEIAETTASLKNCQPAGQAGGTQSSASPKAVAARAKECEQYERKLKLTKENLLRVKEQCDKGLTPGYLPRVIENPGAVPCAQCEANKPLPQEPSAKVLAGLPVSGKVLDLKAGDPNLRTVFGKSAAAPALAAAGVPPVGEPYVDCVCPDGRSLGWMYESECTAKRVTSCGAIQPPIVPPPTEPPPVVQPPTEPPSTGQSPPVAQPPAEKPGIWAKMGNFFKNIGNWVKSLFNPNQEGRPLTGSEIAAAKNVFGDKIDYSKVKLVTTGSGKNRTSGHTIYIPGYDGEKWDQGVLLHEMTHIYQRENYSTTKYWGGRIVDGFLGIVYTFKPENVYKYKLDSNKSFKDYRLEQQAAIVRDYFYDFKSWSRDPVTPDEKKIMKKMLCGEGLLNNQICSV